MTRQEAEARARALRDGCVNRATTEANIEAFYRLVQDVADSMGLDECPDWLMTNGPCLRFKPVIKKREGVA